MIKTTTQTPAVCGPGGCVIEYTWDNAVDPVARVHTFRSAPRVGPEHASIGAQPALLDAIEDEEARQSGVPPLAISVRPETVEGETEEAYRWSFNATRLLLVTFGTLLSAANRIELQNACDLQYGPGTINVLASMPTSIV